MPEVRADRRKRAVQPDKEVMEQPCSCVAGRIQTLGSLMTAKSSVIRGALLCFKAMPFQEVEGHEYHFGGMLLWREKWHPFAFTERIASVDDIIDQIEAGFVFGQSRREYADDDCRITVPFNRMCYGMDPNEDVPMVGLTRGKWVTLFLGWVQSSLNSWRNASGYKTILRETKTKARNAGFFLPHHK